MSEQKRKRVGKRKRPNDDGGGVTKRKKRKKMSNMITRYRDRMRRKRRQKKDRDDPRSRQVKTFERNIIKAKKKVGNQNEILSKILKRAISSSMKKKKKNEGTKKREIIHVTLTKNQCEMFITTNNKLIESLVQLNKLIQEIENEHLRGKTDESEYRTIISGLSNYYFGTYKKNKFFSLDQNEKGVELIRNNMM